MEVVFVKNKKVILLLVVGVLIGAIFIWRESRTEDGFSVHDLNWDDYEGMNERVSSLTLHIPPHFMDRFVETHLDLTGLFLLFSENQHLLRDRPGTAGLTLDSDFEVVLEFTNLLGNEIFLDEAVYDASFYMSFYVDSSLAQESLDLVGAAVRAYHEAQDPEVRITLAEVDWDALRGRYEEYLYGVTIDAPQGGPVNFPVAILNPSDVLYFLEENKHDVSQNRNDLYNYRASILFKRENEEMPRIVCIFFMTESMHEELVSLIDEETWEAARR